MITAIIEKKDRVNAEDVRAIWLRDIKPESAGMVSEPFEAVLLAMAKSGIPARDLGRYCDYAGLNSFADRAMRSVSSTPGIQKEPFRMCSKWGSFIKPPAVAAYSGLR